MSLTPPSSSIWYQSTLTDMLSITSQTKPTVVDLPVSSSSSVLPDRRPSTVYTYSLSPHLIGSVGAAVASRPSRRQRYSSRTHVEEPRYGQRRSAVWGKGVSG